MHPDDLGRTLKIDMDDGTATSFADAVEIAGRRRVGISLGAGWEIGHTATATVVTTLRCAVRAFKGGVFVEAEGDPIASHGWGRGLSLTHLVADAGAVIVDRVPDDVPVVIAILGGAFAGASRRARTLYATWDGWAGGVVVDPDRRLPEQGRMSLAGNLAGAVAISEAFQAAKGNVLAARRDTGLSLWRPDLDWHDPEAVGPDLAFLPSGAWLLGLGHLGQAYAWALGSLPYPDNAHPIIGLVDPQAVVGANLETGILLAADDDRVPKTRVVARELESLGFTTIVVERRFGLGFGRTPEEPAIAFAGFDAPEPRRLLEQVGFVQVVDAGLGGGPRYLDILVHAFPASRSAVDCFPSTEDPRALDRVLGQPAYESEIGALEASGISRETARCGVTELAGRTAGAAFVGAAAASLVVAGTIRDMHGGRRVEVVSLSMSDVSSPRVAANPHQAPRNTGYVGVA